VLATFFLTQPIVGAMAAALVTGEPLTADLSWPARRSPWASA
jgi:hypothetical protein